MGLIASWFRLVRIQELKRRERQRAEGDPEGAARARSRSMGAAYPQKGPIENFFKICLDSLKRAAYKAASFVGNRFLVCLYLFCFLEKYLLTMDAFWFKNSSSFLILWSWYAMIFGNWIVEDSWFVGPNVVETLRVISIIGFKLESLILAQN